MLPCTALRRRRQDPHRREPPHERDPRLQRGTFALGFFTLGASPPRRYLGIWYNNLPGNTTVVWVANRERPFSDSEGSPVALRISNDSINLEVTDSAGAVLWSTNTAGGGNAGAGSNMTAVLLDTGNLVLTATGSDFDARWQSFDHPGDTVLPGMWFNATTRRGNRFSSWKSADDPAPGDFTFGIDPVTALQLIVWKHDRTFYRFTPWDGTVSTTPSFYSNGDVEIKFISSSSMLVILHLDHTGKVQTTAPARPTRTSTAEMSTSPTDASFGTAT